MKPKYLLEYEIRRKLIEFLLERTENERAEVQDYILSTIHSFDEDGKPTYKNYGIPLVHNNENSKTEDEIKKENSITEKIISKDLKPHTDKFLELEKTIILFQAEIKRLNGDSRRKILKSYSPAIKKEAEYKVTKFLVDNWVKNNPGKSKTDGIYEIAELQNKEFAAVKGSYYHKPKKL